MFLPNVTNCLYYVKKWFSDSAMIGEGESVSNITEVDNADDANVVSSRIKEPMVTLDNLIDTGYLSFTPKELHTPVLDIDLPAMLVPSTTPDHYHLYIDAPMSWENYVKLLDVMAEVGILQPGYVAASKARGFTAVRLPWIKKEVNNGTQ